jgi:hypothetical protein
VENLQKLKKVASLWDKNCRQALVNDIKLIEKDLEDLYDQAIRNPMVASEVRDHCKFWNPSTLHSN